MNKLRSDSSWRALTPEQKDKLEGWLFVEQISYADALERAQKEFGIQSSAASLSNFRRRLAEERKSRVLEGAIDWMTKSPETDDETLITEEAVFKMLTISAYEMSLAGMEPAQLKELRKLVTLLLQKRLQATREQRLALEVKREERVSNQSNSAKVVELSERLDKLRPAEMPTPADVEKFMELYRAFDLRERDQEAETPVSVQANSA